MRVAHQRLHPLGRRFGEEVEHDHAAEEIGGVMRDEKNLFKDMPFDEFIENLSDFYGVINMIHPFREGNGRTQRVFFAQLIRNAGYEINFSEIDTDLLMIATIQAAGGVDDSLKAIFRESVHPSMDDRPRKAK